jgi:di/tricarboxylate transporter
MKRKIKIAYSAVAVLLPFIAAAQVSSPTGTSLPSGTINSIIKEVMLWLLGLLGFFAVIGFVISGIMYLVAAGDEDQQSKAKKAMFYSITGVIVGLIGLVIFAAAQTLLGGSSATY